MNYFYRNFLISIIVLLSSTAYAMEQRSIKQPSVKVQILNHTNSKLIISGHTQYQTPLVAKPYTELEILLKPDSKVVISLLEACAKMHELWYSKKLNKKRGWGGDVHIKGGPTIHARNVLLLIGQSHINPDETSFIFFDLHAEAFESSDDESQFKRTENHEATWECT